MKVSEVVGEGQAESPQSGSSAPPWGTEANEVIMDQGEGERASERARERARE